MKVKSVPVSIKAAGEQDGLGDGEFEAIVATWDLDSVGDKIIKGAFAETLEAWKASGNPIPVLWSHMSHDPDYHIGEVLDAEERDEGLWIKARIDLDDEDKKARKVFRLLKGRRVVQFSFAYDIIEGSWIDKVEDGDHTGYYELRKLAIFEVGPTLVGANQATELLDVKSGDQVIRVALPDGRADADTITAAVTKALQDTRAVKAGRTLSEKNETRLRDAAALITEVLDSVQDSSSSGSDDGKSGKDGKATPAPPAATEEPAGVKVDEPAGDGTASDDLRLALELAEFEAQSLTI